MNFVIILALMSTVAGTASQSISMLVLSGKQSNRQVLSAKQVSTYKYHLLFSEHSVRGCERHSSQRHSDVSDAT